MKWLLAMRPRTLPAAAAPVLVGTALAYAGHVFVLGPALAALVGALLLQVGANFANDVFDFDKGADGPDRLGPTRAVAAGLVTPTAMRTATALAFFAAMLVGVYLVWVAGWPIVIVGLLSIAAGLAYTGGPYPLGYHGLGEVFVFLFFGLVAVAGTVYVQALHFDPRTLGYATPIGILTSAIIVVNNLRDRVSDERVGKRTMAVRLGRNGTLVEYRLHLIFAYLAPIVLAIVDHRPWVLLPLVSAPLAIATERKVTKTDGVGLNALLGETARLALVFAALLALGLVIGR